MITRGLFTIMWCGFDPDVGICFKQYGKQTVIRESYTLRVVESKRCRAFQVPTKKIWVNTECVIGHRTVWRNASSANIHSLVIREEVLVYHDNARSHTFLIIRKNSLELWWTVLPHPHYSPDLCFIKFQRKWRTVSKSLHSKPRLLIQTTISGFS